jgi:ABC-type polysaccharide/polyol phosphate export permease
LPEGLWRVLPGVFIGGGGLVDSFEKDRLANRTDLPAQKVLVQTGSKFASDLSKAQLDLLGGLAKAPLWWSLAWQDTKQRYRRSFLGPFWITVSTGVFVGAMGPLYGALLGQDVTTYLQHVAISFIIWTFISSSINESGTAFIGAEGYIKQIALPLSVHILRLLSKNVLMLAHNALIIVLVLIFLPPAHWGSLWLLPFGLLLVLGNLFWIALLLAVLSARFRDIPQIVASVVQVAFFLSPIIWKADMLGPKNRFVADFNPLYHFIEVIRAPLLGQPIHAVSWIVTASLLVLGSIAAFLIFARLRARVPYWL